MSVIREPAVAGLFYSGVAKTLEKEIDRLLSLVIPPKLAGHIKGLVSPHAGYVYSGSTAAVGYKLLKGAGYDTVVIVGPSHKEYFDGISVYPGDAYRTPLGDISVHDGIRNDLVAYDKKISPSHAGHRSEHSIEVQLPFLQRVIEDFSFVPVVMGDQKREYCEVLGRALAETCSGRSVLLVASSDLSHYHHHQVALSLDRQVIDEVDRFDPEALMQKLEGDQVEACGGGPMVSVMLAAKQLGARKAHTLSYCTSGDITGEKEAVVGYLSAALIQEN